MEKKKLSIQEADVLCALYKQEFINQRLLAESSGHSLGVVNKSIRGLTEKGFLDEHMAISEKGKALFLKNKPEKAIILAAGYGMRMVPINMESPKALLEVNGERLIDRLISQLHDAGVTDITVVVGFMKDSFEYLIDEFGAELVYNPYYSSKNNISSLSLVTEKIGNTYIVPSDIWCDNNPFRKEELYSWYMVSDFVDDSSDVRVNRKMELVKKPSTSSGNGMIGICYLTEEDADYVVRQINDFNTDPSYDGKFWEESLYLDDRMIVRARVVHSSDVVEINTYEQLRDLDADSDQLKSDAIDTITTVLGCNEEDITGIEVLKKGMTNRSFSFCADGCKYIMRIPGEGTDQLINRKNEAEVYRTIKGLGLCDDPVYLNPENGYKITKYLEGIRVCDSDDPEDLRKCMEKLRGLHARKLQVGHDFDIFGQIDFYESLWNGRPSVYKDYIKTKQNIMSLKPFIDGAEKDWCLTHIDAVPDNFLFYTPEDGSGELLQLTDWEYSGMQDPHVDIAMFCIYSLYNKDQCDRLIDIYFEGNCDPAVRAKIYAYIAMCGLLWSNWCEYKRSLGVEFGEYSLRQYRFAKDYYRYLLQTDTAKKQAAQED
ncbi:MAG: NTP transferase domain-containing protein [Mogibacterium sp.]|nr:NTP transferase domain-containing protein [Mogibacterium sp.]MBQ6500997.1 NTP transferase domain-containing protein [Mogibacterium sp.]